MDYLELVKVYQELESTSGRLEKTKIISKLLKETSHETMKDIVYLLQGTVFPIWDERKLGMSSQLIIKVISSVAGVSKEEVVKKFRKSGDLGKVAEELIKNKKQHTLFKNKLSVKKVFDNIQKLASLEGQGTVSKKIQLIAELLTSANAEEAKFIVRTVLDELRIGVASGVLRDAIAEAFNCDPKEVEDAFNMNADYGETALLAKEHKLSGVKVSILKPQKVMLALRIENMEEAFKAVGKPAILEYKLDGFRCTIHKQGENIVLFTRNMENVTKQFKEIIPIIKQHVKGDSFILDSELVGFDSKTQKYLPFQKISQRIKRKYDIEKMAKDYPVEINVFDIIYYNQKDLRKTPLRERRKLLEKVIKQQKWKIVLTKKTITDSEKEAEHFYKESLNAGNEGIMIKSIDSEYVPGRYVNGWVKLKPIMETLDLTIIGAEWGEGKRANWLSSFILACRNEDKFVEVGKVGTGIKEKNEGVTFEQLTNELKKNIIKEKGKEVEIKPKLIIEVAFEEIQKSPTYNSGYALRFPRLIRLRNDKPLSEVNTLDDIKKLYKSQ